MNTFVEIRLSDAEQLAGGFDAYVVTFTIAVGSFVVANWTALKQGFAEGAADGYTNLM